MNSKCLSIAGFDGSGGAGIQADLKTFSATGSYGMTVLTAIPVQNTCAVRGVYDVPVQCVEDQLSAIFDDIKPDAIKIGMVYSAEIIDRISSFLCQHARQIPIVLDPVMIAKSGNGLLHKDANNALKNKLIPIATIVTPNIPEAQKLVSSSYSKSELARKILDLGCKSVLVKGGHEYLDTCDDLFLSEECEEILSAPRIHTKNTHGTGCTLSAAMASYLAQGDSLIDACRKAKQYLTGAIQGSSDSKIGCGNGPVHHFYHLWKYL